MHPALRDVAAYYGRVVQRGWRDGRAAVTRNGVLVGLVVAVVAAAVNAVLDDKFDFVSTALAALAGALFVALLAFGWHMIAAPLSLAADDERDQIAEYERRVAEVQRATAPAADALKESDAERRRLEALVDAQAPKLALIEQLQKSDPLFPASYFLGFKRPADEREQQQREAVDAIRAWVSETRAVLKAQAPQYADQFKMKTSLPYRLKLGNAKTPPPPPVRDVLAYFNEARAALSSIIRQM